LQVDGRFCAKCGAAVDAGPTPQQADTPQASSSGLSENAAGALCYLFWFITGIIFLVLAPYNQSRTVRFHAFQSIFASVALFVISIALTIVSTILFAISFWLGSLFSIVHLLYTLAIFLLWLFMMWKTYNNQRVVLPVVGPLAEKQS
jgi:uncharacterized membrane protein